MPTTWAAVPGLDLQFCRQSWPHIPEMRAPQRGPGVPRLCLGGRVEGPGPGPCTGGPSLLCHPQKVYGSLVLFQHHSLSLPRSICWSLGKILCCTAAKSSRVYDCRAAGQRRGAGQGIGGMGQGGLAGSNMAAGPMLAGDS